MDVPAEGLHAVFDRLVPDDVWPAVSAAGLDRYLLELAADPTTAAGHDRILAAVEELRRRAGGDLAALAPGDVDALIAALDPERRDVLVQAAARAYYGDGLGVGARMIGYRPQPGRGPGAPVVEPVLRTSALDDVDDAWDVLVLGAGAGGGVAACVLAEAGARVLVVERGEDRRALEVGRDHLRNHRTSIHGNNTGPSAPGNPRVVGSADGTAVVEAPHDPRWHNDAMVVGGGTRVYQGMAWRFLPDDFRMASTYGVPEGSSLADWPITHDDLVDHWDWVEWEVGVCGDPAGHRALAPRRRGYPMPPLPANAEAATLAQGASSLGLSTGSVPMLLNSVPHAGRARCVRCGECVGFSCPVDAKNGSHNTVLPRALATGNSSLVTGCRAVEITTDAGGRVTGAVLVDEATGTSRSVRAGHVVVACGAIETARLLLASRSDHHPGGLGNGTDQVGRHLQGHAFVSAFGTFDHPVVDPDGPGVSIATLDLAHGNADADGVPLVGGGVVANEMVKLPIVHWSWALPPDAPRWGAAAKAAMRDTYRTTGHLFAQVQEVPRPGNRVTLAPDVRDGLGRSVARLTGEAHPETVRTTRHIADRSRAWMEASGARRTWNDRIPTGLLAGQHQAGTCRMGTDPATSVTDPDGRVHGHDNLWVADASVHVTNGSVNPVLTIMALAHRLAMTLTRL
ncbi:GMC family oxidoreductase [Acidimicrobiia bacterium EGI L10123]|uniref:GMC oxidoreductase n=1 Tax=Salinilacustrithrix flava TaxID=2957203 RepID=UPI003D7C2A1B|nr:GMC family oxidoreductase [Acidimicrobiia bacterium EGI L10123]